MHEKSASYNSYTNIDLVYLKSPKTFKKNFAFSSLALNVGQIAFIAYDKKLSF